MNSYVWPASVHFTEKGIVLGFPEWPELSPMGATVQEAVLVAATGLSTAVKSRLKAGITIPAPSNFGPRQIPIAIDSETAARLDVYIEHQEIKNLQRQNEIMQAYQERRAAFLTEFRVNLEPVEQNRRLADSGAIEFSLVAVRTGYLLNAGGLIAIPAIMKILPDSDLAGGALALPAVVFVVGVVFSFVTNLFAYRSMFKAGEGWGYEESARAMEVIATYYPPEDQTEHSAQIAQHRVDHACKLKSATRCANIGIISFVVSAGCFIGGVASAIYFLG